MADLLFLWFMMMVGARLRGCIASERSIDRDSGERPRESRGPNRRSAEPTGDTVSDRSRRFPVDQPSRDSKLNVSPAAGQNDPRLHYSLGSEEGHMLARRALLVLIIGLPPQAWCQLKIQAVVNAASFQGGMPDVGGLASIFVPGLAGTPGLFTASSALPLPSKLAGVQVTVDGIAAPILAVYIPQLGQSAYGQINIQVPLEWNTSAGSARSTLFVQQFLPGPVQSDLLTPLPTPGWGGFFADQNGYAIAQHASDYSVVTTQNPAHPGETIIAYANGFFPVWPPPPIGFPAPLQPLFVAINPIPIDNGYLFLQTPPQVFPPVGGSIPGASCANTPAVQVTFEGLAPGMVGVEQIKFIVPLDQQPGDWTLFFNNGTSPDGLTCDRVHGSASSPLVKLSVS